MSTHTRPHTLSLLLSFSLLSLSRKIELRFPLRSHKGRDELRRNSHFPRKSVHSVLGENVVEIIAKCGKPYQRSSVNCINAAARRVFRPRGGKHGEETREVSLLLAVGGVRRLASCGMITPITVDQTAQNNVFRNDISSSITRLACFMCARARNNSQSDFLWPIRGSCAISV